VAIESIVECPPARNPRLPHGVDVHAARIAADERASAGSFGRKPYRMRCRGGLAVPAPAGGGSHSGERHVCASNSGELSWPTSRTSRSCAGIVLVDGTGPPRRAYLAAAAPAEVARRERTLDTVTAGVPGTVGRAPQAARAASHTGRKTSSPSDSQTHNADSASVPFSTAAFVGG
jgi:hypothetical protein